MVKKIKVKDEGIQVICPEIRGQLDKVKLSPSMIGSFLNSPGDWVMDKYILELVQKEEKPYFRRGNWFHSIMEKFYSLPQEDRTFDSLKKCTQEVSKESYPDMLQSNEHKEWLRGAIKAYSKNWLSDAKNEKVAQLYINGSNKIGLELFVSGKIGETSRQTLGFIDKIIEGDSGLIVQDWKTGKTISNFNPSKKISDSNPFDYWRQQTIYAILLEQRGAIVEKTSLIFPCSEPPSIIDIDHTSELVRAQVIKDCEQVDKELTEAINNDYWFPFKKGKYNGWASYLCGIGSAIWPSVYQDKVLELVEMEG